MGSDDSEMENRDRVLAPDDLDIADQPEVAEIDDGRYVVSADGPAKQPDEEILENPDWLSDDEQDEETAAAPTNQSVTADQPNQTTPPTDRDRQSSTGSQPNQAQPSQHQSNREQSTQPQQTQSQPTQQSNQGQPNQPQPGRTQPNQSQPPTGGQPDRGQPNRGRSDQQHPNQGQPSRNQPNQSQSNRGQPTQQQPSKGQPNQGQPSRGQQPPAGDQQSRQQQPPGNRSASSQPTADDRQRPTGGRGRSDHPHSSELAAHDQPPVEPPAAELTNENVSKFLAKELTQGSGDYGFDATLNVEGQVNRGRMTSDDIGETLETLLRWYANQTTDEVDTEAVLGIILAGTDLAVEYPVQSAYTTVKRYGLTPDDSIGDLLKAIRKEGSFTVPPSKD